MKLYWFLFLKDKNQISCKPITCTSSPDVGRGCAVDWSPIWEKTFHCFVDLDVKPSSIQPLELLKLMGLDLCF